jgi:large subunit ribosomal protein L21
MYAVITTGGKQYKVQENDVIDIERLGTDVGEKVTFSEVLCVNDGKDLKVGSPLLDGASVEAEVVDNYRGKKLVAFKMKRRKGYRKKIGHRQEITQVKISSIKA